MQERDDIDSGLIRAQRPAAIILAVMYASILSAALFLLPRLGLIPLDAEHWTADWRTALLSPRASGQHKSVALVLINDGTLDRFPYVSPIDRRLVAKIVRAVDWAGAKGIGIDIIFDRASEPAKDKQLTGTLRASDAEIVLGSVDDDQLNAKQRAFQKDFLESVGRKAGHVHFVLRGSRLAIDADTVREIPPQLHGRQSLAYQMASLNDEVAMPSSNLIAWQRRPEDGVDLFVTIPAQVLLEASANPQGVLAKRVKQALSEKLVFIGGDFANRDRHPTPLSVVREERVPGVTVHAQIAAQLVDGRSLKELGPHIEIAILFTLALIGTLLGWRYRLKKLDLLMGLLGTAALVAIDFLAYARFGLVLPFATHWQAWILGVTGGHFIGRTIGGDRVGWKSGGDLAR